MVNKNIRNRLHSNTIVFDSPAFDNSIIGISFNGRAIYILDLMVKELAYDDGISYEDALDYIEYNTMRTIPYIGVNAPIVLKDAYMLLEKQDD